MIIDFSKTKTLVIKVGTNTISSKDSTLDRDRMAHIVDQIASIFKGRHVVLVTSGAVGAGIDELGLKQRPRALEELQACAAVGQSVLMRVYYDLFKDHGLKISQILLAEEDFSDRRRYLNFRNAIHALLEKGVIPIVNENDVIATHELKVGDNDTLAAMIASNIDADLLLMLSDIDGVYDRDPKKPGAKKIPSVSEITPAMDRLKGRGKGYSVGGITTKIQAAKICMNAGVPMNLVLGTQKDIIVKVLANERFGTVFLPQRKHNAKERWIGFARPKGIIAIDDGAKMALSQGKSLLASGIDDVHGIFRRGDLLIIQNKEIEFGKGIIEYSSDDLNRIKGKSSKEIMGLMGFANPAIQRDNLVLHT